MTWICQLFRRKKKTATKFQHFENLYEWNTVERKLLEDINLYRAEKGLHPLKPDRYCREQAQIRTAYCIYRQKVTHEQMGCVVENNKKVGLSNYRENLSFGYSTAEHILDAWIESDGHNRTLLHKDSVYVGISSQLDENLRRYTTLGLFY